jgi:hypothetical protein
MEDHSENSFAKDAEKFTQQAMLSGKFRQKKLILWFVRTLLAALLFVVFWEYSWVRWALGFYIPLNLFGLYAIFKFTNTVDAKMQEVFEKIDALETALDDEEE